MVIGVLIHEANKCEALRKKEAVMTGVGQMETSRSLPKVNKHKEEKKIQ